MVSHTIRTILGIGLLILAVIGIFVPVMPQLLFFMAAVGVLGTDHVIVKWCYRHMERYKDYAIVKWCVKQTERAKEWVRRWQGKKDAEPKV